MSDFLDTFLSWTEGPVYVRKSDRETASVSFFNLKLTLKDGAVEERRRFVLVKQNTGPWYSKLENRAPSLANCSSSSHSQNTHTADPKEFRPRCLSRLSMPCIVVCVVESSSLWLATPLPSASPLVSIFLPFPFLRSFDGSASPSTLASCSSTRLPCSPIWVSSGFSPCFSCSLFSRCTSSFGVFPLSSFRRFHHFTDAHPTAQPPIVNTKATAQDPKTQFLLGSPLLISLMFIS